MDFADLERVTRSVRFRTISSLLLVLAGSTWGLERVWGAEIAAATAVTPGPAKYAQVASPGKVLGLTFVADSGEIKAGAVVVRGQLARAAGSVLWEGKPLPLMKDGTFSVRVPATETGAREFEVTVVDSKGKTEVEKITLTVTSTPAARIVPSRFVIHPSVGVTTINYNEATESGSYSRHFSQLGITAKALMSYSLSPQWDLGLSSYFTVAALSANQEAAARFLGVNVRAGYSMPWIPEPYRVTISPGIYYTTMFVSSSAYHFGFADLVGPQLVISGSRAIKTGRVSLYGKFAPVSDSFSSLSFSNNETAAGLAYEHGVGAGAVSVSLDAALFSLLIETVRIRSSSLSVSVGYRF